MSKRSYRWSLLFLTALSFFVLAASFYYEYVEGLTPCPLCLMQRFSVMGIGFFSLMGICLSTLKRAHFVSLMQVFFALAGIFFSTRQLWLQTLPPDKAASCLPGLDILMRYFPWTDVVKALFWGSADCGEIKWQMWGLSMPAWALIYFIGILFAAVFLYKKTGNNRQI